MTSGRLSSHLLWWKSLSSLSLNTYDCHKIIHGPIPICLLVKQFCRRCSVPCSPLYSPPPWISQHLCLDPFVDFSSTLNTIIPHQLCDKLCLLNADIEMFKWILDFFLCRNQVVKVSGQLSASLTLNTGTPQGWVLSSMLFILFTNDCMSYHDSVWTFKFSFDTTLKVWYTTVTNQNIRKRLGGWWTGVLKTT